MLKLIAGAALAAILVSSASATVMPAPLPVDTQIVNVSGGCGPAGWRDRIGRCHFRHRGPVVYGAPVYAPMYPVYPVCPPGTRLSLRHGVCVPVWGRPFYGYPHGY